MTDQQHHHNRVHGHAGRQSHSGTYVSWMSMKQRCQYPKSKDYPAYGGAGIRVCDRWQSFANFLEDMGDRPPGLTLDRYPDRRGNYEPGNCRWATAKAQTVNRKATNFYEFSGRTLTLTDISSISGAPYALLYRRVRAGRTAEEAVAEFKAGDFKTYKTVPR